jgi:hypothetical protein
MAEAMEKQMKLFEDDNVSSAKDKASKKLDTGLKELRGDRKETFDKMTEMLISGKVNDMSLKEKENFVTLYKMLKQHHGFSEGGLEQDGGTVDPVSGNEVPMGSSQEEVRDDIPAQLSEGEFVFPADVVRFIGLSKLMKLRQQAKAGLKRMEDMGQMGNSEEAILPDDIPFDMDDLNLEDDTLELQEGGMAGALVQGAARTFGGRNYADNINVQQGQTFGSQDFSIPPIGTQPIQPTPTDDYVSPIQAPTPVEAPVDPLPPFNVFVPPVADEYREYVNDEGIIINVPFFRGNILPGYTVPKGFRPKETEPVDTIEDDALMDITEPEQDDRESRIKREEEEIKNRERSYDNVVSQIMQDNPGASLEDITKKIKDGEATVNIFGKTIKAPGFLFNEDDITAAYDRAFSGPVSDFEADVEPEGPIRRGTLIGTDKETGKVTDDVAPDSAKSLNLTDKENEDIRKAAEEFAIKQAAIKEAEKRSRIESVAKQEAERKRLQAEAEATAAANRAKIAAEQAAKEAAKTRQQRLADEAERDRRQRERDEAQKAREDRTKAERQQAAKQKREGGRGYVRAKGGVIEKPKKKMKRGGLASKK